MSPPYFGPSSSAVPASSNQHSRSGHEGASAATPQPDSADDNGASTWNRLTRFVTGGFGSSTKSGSPVKEASIPIAKPPLSRLGLSISQKAQARLVSSAIFDTSVSSLDLTYNAGGEVTAIDLNHTRDCVVIAGRDLLKIARVDKNTCGEEFNIRLAAGKGQIGTGETLPRKPALTREAFDIHDVKWCHGRFSNVIATAAAFSRIVLYDVTAPDPVTPRAKYGLSITRLSDHKSQVHKLAFNPHQSGQLLSASQDGTVMLWDLRDLRSEQAALHSDIPVGSMSSRSRFAHTSGGGFRDVKWSPADGHVFAAATNGGAVVSWDIRFPRTVRTSFAAHSPSALTVDWHPAGRWLASGGLDSTIKIWDMYMPVEDRTDGVIGRRSSATVARPQWTINAPFQVVNVQWRPPARSPIPSSSSFFGHEATGSGSFDSWAAAESALIGDPSPGIGPTGSAWLTTQFSVSYVEEFPQIHVWDLRRPHVPLYDVLRPFREPWALLSDPGADDDTYSGLFKYPPAGRFSIATSARTGPDIATVADGMASATSTTKVKDLPSYAHRTAPTDMIWHSRDLMWVGGLDGTFCQVDVARGEMAYKPVERRAWTHVSVGARGEGVVVAADRPESGTRGARMPVVNVPVVPAKAGTRVEHDVQAERNARTEIGVVATPPLAMEMTSLSGPTLAAGSALAKAIAIAKLRDRSRFVDERDPTAKSGKKVKISEPHLGADDAVDGAFLSIRPDDGSGIAQTPSGHASTTPVSESPDRTKRRAVHPRPSFSGSFGMAAALAAVGVNLGGDSVRAGSSGEVAVDTEGHVSGPAIWPPSMDATSGAASDAVGPSAQSGLDELITDQDHDDAAGASANNSGCEVSPADRIARAQRRQHRYRQRHRQVVVPIHVIPLDESMPRHDRPEQARLEFPMQRCGRVVLPGMAPQIRRSNHIDGSMKCRLFLPDRLFTRLRTGSGHVTHSDSDNSFTFTPDPDGLQLVCESLQRVFEANAEIATQKVQMRTAQALKIIGYTAGWWVVDRVVEAGRAMAVRLTDRADGELDFPRHSDVAQFDPGGLWPSDLMHNPTGDDGDDDDDGGYHFDTDSAQCSLARQILGIQKSDFLAPACPDSFPPAPFLPVPSADFPIRLPGVINQALALFSQSARTADALAQALLLVMPVLGLVRPSDPAPSSFSSLLFRRSKENSALASLRSSFEVSSSLALKPESLLIPAALQHLARIAATVDPLQVEAVLCAYLDQLIRRRDYISAAIVRRITFPIFVSVWEAGCVGVSVALGSGKCGRTVKGAYGWGGVYFPSVSTHDSADTASDATFDGNYRDDDTHHRPDTAGQLHRRLAALSRRGRADLTERRRHGPDIDWGDVVDRHRKQVSSTHDQTVRNHQFFGDATPRPLYAPAAFLLTWRGLTCDAQSKCEVQKQHARDLATAVCDLCSSPVSPFSRRGTRTGDGVIKASSIGLGMGIFADSHPTGFFAELFVSQVGVGMWHGGRADHVVRMNGRTDKSGRTHGGDGMADLIFPPPVCPSILSACLMCGHVGHADCKREWFLATASFAGKQRSAIRRLRSRRRAESARFGLIVPVTPVMDESDESDSESLSGLDSSPASLWSRSFAGQCHFPGCSCACLPVSDWGRAMGIGTDVVSAVGLASGCPSLSTAGSGSFAAVGGRRPTGSSTMTPGKSKAGVNTPVGPRSRSVYSMHNVPPPPLPSRESTEAIGADISLEPAISSGTSASTTTTTTIPHADWDPYPTLGYDTSPSDDDSDSSDDDDDDGDETEDEDSRNRTDRRFRDGTSTPLSQDSGRLDGQRYRRGLDRLDEHGDGGNSADQKGGRKSLLGSIFGRTKG